MNGPSGLPLPLHLILEIVSYLDSYSVLDFLNAFLCLKSQTVLITDHLLPPLLFSIDGVTRKLIVPPAAEVQFANQKNAYNQELDDDRYQIRLVEYYFLESMEHLKESLLGPRFDEICHPKFDDTTFVFFRSVIDRKSAWEAIGKITEHFDEKNQCKWHSGLGVFSTEDAWDLEAYDHACSSRQPGLQLGPDLHWVLRTRLLCSGLRSLKIEGIAEIRNVTFPILRHLSIVFRSHGDRRRLTISSLFAPKLVYCVIHYDGSFPHLEKVSVKPPDIDLMPTSVGTNSKLEITNISTLQENRHPFMAYTTNDENFTVPDPRFVRGFRHIVLKGVPTALVHLLDLSQVLFFRWSMSDSISEDKYIEMPLLLSFVLQARACNSKLPLIKAPDIYSLQIQLMAPNIDITPAWKCDIKRETFVLEHFSIYNSLPLLRRKGLSGDIPSLPRGFFSHMGCLGYLSVVGLHIPEFNCDLRDSKNAQVMVMFEEAVLRPVVAPPGYRATYDQSGMSVSLVQEECTRDTRTIYIDKLSFFPSYPRSLDYASKISTRINFTISPILLTGTSNQVPVKLCMVAPRLFVVQGRRNQRAKVPVFHTDPEVIETAIINDRHLEMEDQRPDNNGLVSSTVESKLLKSARKRKFKRAKRKRCG